MEQLYTRWGKTLDADHVLQEYPRPLLKRDSYVNLNGYWDYAVTKQFKRPEKYDGRILVPFSPDWEKLDQGYWPDGLYTAPSDEAMIFDIREMKKLGFNMIRKHIKIVPQRWYSPCDRLGMGDL